MVLDENVIRSTSNRNATRFGLTQLGEEEEGKQMEMIPRLRIAIENPTKHTHTVICVTE